MQTKQTTARCNVSRKLAFGLLISLITFLAAAPNTQAANGTWTNLLGTNGVAIGNASGSWANVTNWNNGVIANGVDNTADFSTLDITSNSIVTLDGARTIGNLVFGDTTPSTNWVLNPGTGGTLTLNGIAGTPTITANNGSNTISVVVAGTNGFNKAGPGLINLTGANTVFSNIYVNAGILMAGSAGAFGAQTPNGNPVPWTNAVIIASGATVQVAPAQAPALKPAYVSGAGVGGTQGEIYADLSSLAQGNSSTRWSIGLLANPSPAVVMLGDTTIRVDGTNNTVLASSMLIGHITTSNALTGHFANDTNITLTKTGTGQLRVDSASGYTGGNIHIVGGSLAWGNNLDLLGFQTVTVDAGTQLHCRNVSSMNSINSTIVLNGLLSLNARGAADTTIGTQIIGYLSGSGMVTNDNNAAQTLVIAGTNGTSTTFSGTIVKTTNALASINLQLQNTNGTLRLTGANTYVGTTVVNAGTLLVNGSHTGGGAYTVGTSAILGGNGSISTNITVNDRGMVSAGDPLTLGGTFTVGSILDGTGVSSVMVSNATLAASGQIGASGAPVDNIVLNNGSLTLKLSLGSLTVFVTNFAADALSLGQFPLIHYNTIGGSSGFGGLSFGTVPVGVSAYLSNNVANTSVDIVITAAPLATWTGLQNGDWDIGITTNWNKGGINTNYADGLYVSFDDTSTRTSVNMMTNVSPQSTAFFIDTKNYTLTGIGSLNGTGGLIKQGAATLTIANTNNLSGGVVINNGVLQLGNGGTAGTLGSAAIINAASLTFNHSDNITFPNAISGDGALVKQAADTVTLNGIGPGSGAITVNSGTLALAPAGTITRSGSVTGSGAFGMAGAGTVILTSGTVTYGGGTVISGGTLQFGDGTGNGVFPPAGAITDNGTLALALSGTLANSISGSGGVSIIANAIVTFSSAETYAGPTFVSGALGSTLNATASTYPSGSALTLGSQTGSGDIGTVNFSAGNPVLGGLKAGGNFASTTANQVNLTAGGQTLSINGNVSVGNIAPAGATVSFVVTGTGVSVVVNTNGGTIQIGLGAFGTGVDPDNVLVNFSGINNFVANLGTSTNGTNSVFNMGTLDANPAPGAGTLMANEFDLAVLSNSITAGTITVGAGGRQLTPYLRLGPGTNILNVGTFNVGTGGRDGGKVDFYGFGGLQVRGAAGGSTRANYNQGVNATSGTGAGFSTTVDFSGGYADLLFGPMSIGNEPVRVGGWTNVFTFSQGVLDATSVSLSQGCNTNLVNYSIMNINGGTATLGPVSLTASRANGTLNIMIGSVSVRGITATGTGVATLSVSSAPLTSVGAIGSAARMIDAISLSDCPLSIGRSAGYGNPTSALVNATNLTLSGTCPIRLTGTNYVVGQFPLISYVGSIGDGGVGSIGTFTPPPGVAATLVDNSANHSVDVKITAAPPLGPIASLKAASGPGTLGLSWLDLGMILQTNSVGLTSPTNWFAYPGSTSVTNVTITTDSSKTNVFFRLVYP
jgi:autotransporter-associated beta strand protein